MSLPLVTPIEIPEHIPKPDMSLLKEEQQTEQTEQIKDKENYTNQDKTDTPTDTPPRSNIWQHFLSFQPDGTESPNPNTEGTISGMLPSTKHMSPTEYDNEIEHKKKKNQMNKLYQT